MSEPIAEARRLFGEGIRHFEAGRFEEAEAAFQASLVHLPGRVSTLTNLAATRIRLGRPAQSLPPLDEVLAAQPDDADAWSHRGTALGALERHDEALACHERALAIDATRVPDWYHRGIALNVLRRHDAALEAFERALALAPDHAEGWYRHGQTLQSLNRAAHALASYDKALAIDPGHAQAWSNRGGILKDLKRLDEAVRSFEQALAHGADAALNRYYLASLVGRDLPTAAPRQYVETLFDDYAGTFDEHLVGVLHYRAHVVLTDRLKALGRGRFASALDLGCGTGLCGPLLQPVVDRIDGVDLSARMLERARALGIYERLELADVNEYLQSTDRDYDLVLAADVFIYLGDLAPVFRAARRVLRTGGVFCCSVEAADEDLDFALRPSLRFAHSERYLRDLAQQHGFEVLDLMRHSLREDQRQQIPGLFLFLAKTGARVPRPEPGA